MRTAITAFAAIAALVVAQSAAGATPDRFHDANTEHSAGAQFASTSGCVATTVDVVDNIADGTTSSNDGVTRYHLTLPVRLEVSQRDTCTDTQLLDAFVPCCDSVAPPPDFRVAPNLTSASLHATVPVFDNVSSDWIDMAVDLNWTAIPPLTSLPQLVGCSSPGLPLLHFRDIGVGYGAAASGTVSDGTTNYTPDVAMNDHTFISKDRFNFLVLGGNPPC
jgi:hypothetical protein